MYNYLTLVWILIQIEYKEGGRLVQPSFTSDWHVIESQRNRNSRVDISLPSGVDLPVKVIVEVKIQEHGRNYIFNAAGSAERDDDRKGTYGGIVYFYNKSEIRIWAPNKEKNDSNGGESDGVVIYLGTKEKWTGPRWFTRIFQRGEVRAKVWYNEDMTPDFDSNFTHKLDTMKNTYKEVHLPLKTNADHVIIQVKDENGFWVSEGIGMPTCFDCGHESGGVVFAYSSNTLRLWTKLDGAVISAADGWGYDSLNNQRRFSQACLVRIMAWKFVTDDCRWKKENTIVITREDQSVSASLAYDAFIPTESTLVVVKIQPVSGINSDFWFHGSGSVMNEGEYGNYGGLIYTYHEEGVDTWRVSTNNGQSHYSTQPPYVFGIGHPWGNGTSSDFSNDVLINITIFGLESHNDACLKSDLNIPEADVHPNFTSHNKYLPCTSTVMQCRTGFKMVNAGWSRVNCSLSATWEYMTKERICTEIFCPTPHMTRNVIIEDIDHIYLGNVTFGCKPGYREASGMFTQTCGEDANWINGSTPVCEEIRCPLALTSVKCKSGYRMIQGTFRQTCNEDGKWIDGSMPVCTEITCPTLDDPAHGTVHISSRSVNSTVEYECDNGFQFYRESPERRCLQNGSWSGEEPLCAEVRCRILKDPVNGTVTKTNGTINETAFYKCNKWFSVSGGNTTRQCTSGGRWTGKAITCTECRCPCNKINIPKFTNTSDATFMEEINTMTEQLKVLKSETRKAKRSKISAKDFRPASTISGTIWIIIIVVIVLFTVVPDIPILFKHILQGP